MLLGREAGELVATRVLETGGERRRARPGRRLVVLAEAGVVARVGERVEHDVLVERAAVGEALAVVADDPDADPGDSADVSDSTSPP